MAKAGKKKFRYIEIYENLLDRIIQGEFPLDSFIPSEKELCQIFSVERTTVRKALDLLVTDGLVKKSQGIGVKVVSHQKQIRESSHYSESDTILFFLPKTTNNVDRLTQAYYSQMLFHLEAEFKKKGYKIIYSTISSQDNIKEILKPYSFAGIIFSSYGVDRNHLDYIQENGIPFITVNNDYRKSVVLTPDNFRGGYLVAKHLTELGHRKIAVVKGREEDASCKHRLAGFLSGLRDHNLNLQDSYIRSTDWLAQDALAKTKEILDENSENLPTAIFAFNDEMALSAIRVINEKGLRVPDDISVVGFDDISQSRFFSPPLTTINCNVEILSRTAVWMLLQKIKDPGLDNFTITIPVELIIRNSTAKVPD